MHRQLCFLDYSGAQMTIISKPCAERCSILHLMDTRFASMAHGVGSAPIRGRIHLALVTLGEEKKETFGMTYSVMDTIGGDFDMILGLDMLRKHRAKIDLDEYCMHIGTIAVPFMDENLEALDAGIDGKKDAGGKEGSGKADGVPATGSEAVSGSGSGSGNREGGSAGGRGNLGGIQNLLELGFSQAEAEEALRACNGNTDQAATMLASRKYGF